MILKNLSRKSGVGQLVNYLFKHENEIKPKPLLKHNMRARSIKGWTKEFEQNDDLRLRRRSDSAKIQHTILSFHSNDNKNVSDKLLKDIVKKYINLRGTDNMYLVTKHSDQKHLHLHIAQSSVKYLTGETNRLSKKEFQELKINLQEYQRQKYPELESSLVAHRKFEKSRALDIKPQVFDKRHSHKQLVYQEVEKIYKNSKSLDSFYKNLKAQGYEPYQRGSATYGVEHEGRSFRFRTMGLTSEKLEELNKQTEKEEKSLRELKELRNSKAQDRESEESNFANPHSNKDSRRLEIGFER